MPKPSVCLAFALCQYLELFRGCFKPRQWKYFVTVLSGLVECQERRTLSGMQRTAGDRPSLSGLSRFIGRWPWAADKLATIWQAHFRKEMAFLVQEAHTQLKAEQVKQTGRAKKTVVTGYLVLDDSVHHKPKGKKMEGLGKHYSSTEQKVVIGHNLFTGVYLVLGRRCPLAPRLYLTKAACEKSGVNFKSKVEMALEQVMSFTPVEGTRTHVLVDSWYHCQALRKTTRQRNFDLSGGLRNNRYLRVVREDGSREWVSLAKYGASLRESDWQVLKWPSEEGGQPVYVHAVRTQVRKLGATKVLIVRQSLADPLSKTRYFGSTLLEADTQTILEVLAKRWAVEVLFEDAKDLLGSDHYQVMRSVAVERFWTLVFCLGYFLDEQRDKLQAVQPQVRVTWGDARRSLQHTQQLNLLIWLQKRFQVGDSPQDLYDRLVA